MLERMLGKGMDWYAYDIRYVNGWKDVCEHEQVACSPSTEIRIEMNVCEREKRTGGKSVEWEMN